MIGCYMVAGLLGARWTAIWRRLCGLCRCARPSNCCSPETGCAQQWELNIAGGAGDPDSCHACFLVCLHDDVTVKLSQAQRSCMGRLGSMISKVVLLASSESSSGLCWQAVGARDGVLSSMDLPEASSIGAAESSSPAPSVMDDVDLMSDVL